VVTTRGRDQSGHGGEPTVDSTTAKISNKLRGNGHWTSTYMSLQENLAGEASKGVLTEGRRFCGGARADGEETPVRGRVSGRGGRRGGLGGAPWWHRACCWVGEVQEHVEKVAAGEVLREEDDGGEIPWPGFASRRCGQALGAGGAW
jgi:hypothetical protein